MEKITNNKITFIIFGSISILIGMLSSFFLPEKFFYDAQIIVDDPFNEIGWFKGSYPFTISLYHLFRLNKLPFFIIALIQLPILFYILNKIGIPKDFNRLTLRNIFLYISFLLIGVFIGQPSKEFISFIVIGIVTLVISSKRLEFKLKLLLTTIIFVIAGFLFRPYYLIVPFMWCSILYLGAILPKKHKMLSSVFIGLVVLIGISSMYFFLKGDFLSEVYRERINDLRRGEDYAQSIIESPLRPLSFFTEFFSIIYGVISVNFPILNLKLLIKPQIFCFVLWQLILDLFLIQSLIRVVKRMDKNLFLMLLLCLSFFLLQGIFEPDLGSAIRHKIGFFPAIYYIVIYGKKHITK